MLGKTCQINLNKNIDNFDFLKVTFEPIGAPFLSFNEANDFFDLIKKERWVVISSKKVEIFINDFNEIFFFCVCKMVNFSRLHETSCIFEYVKQRNK